MKKGDTITLVGGKKFSPIGADSLLVVEVQQDKRAEGAPVDKSRRYWLVVDDRGIAVTPSLHDDEERATVVLEDFRRVARSSRRQVQLRVVRVALAEAPAESPTTRPSPEEQRR